MKPRDGIIHWNGLTAEFRFIASDAACSATSAVETATGPVWVEDALLQWDPPRDLSPEAATVVEKAKEAP